MNRIRRIALEILNKHPNLFTNDYNHNKEAISKVAIFRSKELRNKVIGYITRYINKESRKEKEVIQQI